MGCCSIVMERGCCSAAKPWSWLQPCPACQFQRLIWIFTSCHLSHMLFICHIPAKYQRIVLLSSTADISSAQQKEVCKPYLHQSGVIFMRSSLEIAWEHA